jgi:hypothetical protein
MAIVRLEGLGHLKNPGRLGVRFHMRLLHFSIDPILPAALWSNQPLTEMSTRNLPGDKGRPGLSTSQPSMNRLSRKCGRFDVSQPHEPPRPITGILLVDITF